MCWTLFVFKLSQGSNIRDQRLKNIFPRKCFVSISQYLLELGWPWRPITIHYFISFESSSLFLPVSVNVFSLSLHYSRLEYVELLFCNIAYIYICNCLSLFWRHLRANSHSFSKYCRYHISEKGPLRWMSTKVLAVTRTPVRIEDRRVALTARSAVNATWRVYEAVWPLADSVCLRKRFCSASNCHGYYDVGQRTEADAKERIEGLGRKHAVGGVHQAPVC